MALKSGRPGGRTRQHVEDSGARVSDLEPLHILVPKGTKRALKVWCAQNDMNVSDYVRAMLEKQMKADGIGM